MDVIKEVRGAIVGLLAGAGYSVYDHFYPDDEAAGTYIVISTQDDSEQADKCDNGHRVGTTLDIIHRTNANHGSVYCDDVAAVVVPLVRNSTLILPAGMVYIQGSGRKTSDNSLDGLSDTFKVYRRVIRFEHIIKSN